MVGMQSLEFNSDKWQVDLKYVDACTPGMYSWTTPPQEDDPAESSAKEVPISNLAQDEDGGIYATHLHPNPTNLAPLLTRVGVDEHQIRYRRRASTEPLAPDGAALCHFQRPKISCFFIVV